jgi:hypothetical protein
LPQRLRCHPRRRTPSIKMVLTWMDGWYKGDSDEAIIGTDVLVEDQEVHLLPEESDHEHRQRRGSRSRKVSVGRNVFGGLRLC